MTIEQIQPRLFWEVIDLYKKLVDKLETSTGQKFSFLSRVIWEEIALPKKIKFLNGDSGRAGPDTKRMLIYDLLVPFNNEHHTDEHCVAAENLTLFYKNKEKNEGLDDLESQV